MKKYIKYITQWSFVSRSESLRHKKETITQRCTNLTKQSLIIFFISAISIFSQTLEDYLKIAAENNPGLKSKFYSYQASLEKIPQVGSLPDPQLSFAYFIEPMERFMGNQIADFSLMQMFPWFGTLSAAENETALMAKAKYEAFNDAKSMLFYNVKKILYELYFLRKEIEITEENLEILKTLEKLAINSLKAGVSSQSESSMNSKMKSEQLPSSSSGMDGMNMGSQNSSTLAAQQKSNMSSMNNMYVVSADNSMINVLRVQLEVNELQNKLELLNDSMKPLIVQFNNLLNRSENELINIPDTLNPSQLPLEITEVAENIRSQNPMLRMLQLEEEAFVAQEEMNRKMSYPMFGLGLQYSIFQQRSGSTMEPNNMIMPMATINIPIWRGKYNGAIGESKIRQKEISQLRLETSNQLISNYENIIKEFNDAERKFELYERQKSIAQQTLDLLIVQYSTSGTQFEEVLRMQQQLLDYRLQILKAVFNLNLSIAKIERLLGR